MYCKMSSHDCKIKLLFHFVYFCKECSSALGMESRHIKDAQITASSQWHGNYAAIQGRLNFKASGGKQGGWSARSNNGNQWIQVALGSYTKLTSIATQGRNAHSQWVTAYKLQYSEDGVNFYYYKVPGQSSPKVNVEAVASFKTVENNILMSAQYTGNSYYMLQVVLLSYLQ